MPGFPLRDVKIFRYLTFRGSCMAPPRAFWYSWSRKSKNIGYLWWFQAELRCSENHCRTSKNWWSHFGKNRCIYAPNGNPCAMEQTMDDHHKRFRFQHWITKYPWQAYQLIFENLEAFYNTKRIHSHCNYMSPNEFERVYERTHTEAELLAG